MLGDRTRAIPGDGTRAVLGDVALPIVNAFGAKDLAALRPLVHREVVWDGADGRIACQGRDEVLDRLRQPIEEGGWGRIVEFQISGAHVVIGLAVAPAEGSPPPAPGRQPFYLLMTTRGGRVAHIQSCADRDHAIQLIGVT